MPEANPHPLLDVFARERCSAILRTPVAEAVAPAMRAAVEGGFRIIEFTLNTPDALAHIEAFARHEDLVVGAGTVLDTALAEAAVAAGARFVVSPVVDPDVIRYCVERDVLCVPGAFTPTEMLTAWRLGAHLVKLFPGPAEGPRYLRACRGPLPELRIFPTSGVTLDDAQEWLAAGAFGVGFVQCLFAPEDLREKRFDRIRERAARMVEAVRSAPR